MTGKDKTYFYLNRKGAKAQSIQVQKSSSRLRVFAIQSIIILFFSAWSAPVSAQKTGALFSGAYLLQLCQRDAAGNEMVPGGAAACQSYISGIIDYHNLLRSLGTAPSAICVDATGAVLMPSAIAWRWRPRALTLRGSSSHRK